MNAIKKDIEKRVEKLRKYYYENPGKIATINLLEDIAHAVDFYQRQVAQSYKSIDWEKQQGFIPSTKERYHNWEIKKATLTRLQERYRKVLELLFITR
tara:strand:- start:471 stop:764 length:294 start_codon:yes stop_codon:yes gene_type:complete